jgi:benzodiazapine receptor
VRTRRSAHAQHDNNDAGELHNPKMWVDIAALIIAVAIPLAVGCTGTAVGGGGQSVWYKELNKPSWIPPDWLFPVMWTALYVLMGIASWLIWKEGGFEGQSYPLAAYFFQLLLNFLWTPIFFGLRRPDLGLVEIVVLWLAIAVTIYLFWHVNTIAAYLLVPYILWVTVAIALNWYIWMYNGQAEQEITEPLHHGQSV